MPPKRRKSSKTKGRKLLVKRVKLLIKNPWVIGTGILLTILGFVIGGISLYKTVQYGRQSPTKNDTDNIKNVIERVDERTARIEETMNPPEPKTVMSPSKSFEELEKATGKSCDYYGATICSRLKLGTDALYKGDFAVAESLYEPLAEIYSKVSLFHFNLG